MERGTLFVKLESAREALPVQGRVVISQTVNGVRVLEIELVTDEDGLTQPVTLDAPDRSISLDPASTQQAWAAYDVEAYADGYSDILLEGVQVYSGVEAYAPIRHASYFFLPGGFAHSRHGGHRFHLPRGPAGHPAHHHPRARHPRRLRQRPRAALHLCHAASGAAKRIHPPVHHRASGRAAEQRRQ